MNPSAEMRFWLADFEVPPAAVTENLSRVLLPHEEDGTCVTVELVWYADEGSSDVPPADAALAVFLSRSRKGVAADRLSCRLGFCNDTRRTIGLADLGFPMVDAAIRINEENKLFVTMPAFLGESADQQQRMRLNEDLLIIEGVDFKVGTAPSPASGRFGATEYVQDRQMPDPARFDTELLVSPVAWKVRRKDVTPKDPSAVKVNGVSARFPDLQPLIGLDKSARQIVSGRIVADPVGSLVSPAPFRRRRDRVFVPPAYRFEQVDVLGFRLDLTPFGDAGARYLQDTVDQLNFHLRENAGGVATDFRYEPASRTVMVEVLRYGKMKLERPIEPLSAEDYQFQHEMVLRVLVGRVDDDTAQARDPAVFVPAIFVDNPWSKFLGREVQGFDKRLAQFWAGDEALQADGRAARNLSADRADDPVPLRLVSGVRTVSRVGGPPGGPLLQIRHMHVQDDGDDILEDVDLQLALGRSSLLGTSWRQADFGQVEFRRSFARQVYTDSALGFRSIQVSPVGERSFASPALPGTGVQGACDAALARESALERTWITGQFTVDHVQVAHPRGIVGLDFHADATSPTAWWKLVGLLDGGQFDPLCDKGSREDRAPRQARFDLPTGDWYRMVSTMSLRIGEVLAW